jgi:shikimate dehydrogenase
MSISGAAKIAGIVGWPVAHSLSPRLHGFWLAEHRIDGAYVPLAVRPEDFSTAIRGLRLSGFKGVSVTVPHKEAAFALADRNDDAAQAAGAVNLLVFHEDGSIEGSNTDAPGLAASLNEALAPGELQGKPVVLLGAGGAARAAVLALNALGASEIRILSRAKQRGDAFAAALAPRSEAHLVSLGFDAWPQAAKDAALLLNTTSAGLKGAPSIDLPLDALPPDAAVCDIVYNPLETQLLQRARARGHRTIDGLGMLMHQAVPAFHACFGVTPKVTPELRRMLEEALRHG